MNYYFQLFQFLTIELWKDIKGYEGIYAISSFGRVMNLNTGLIRKTWINRYENVSISKKKFLVHRLVANSFIGEIGDLEVNHITGIKTFNYYWALEIITRSENKKHAINAGLIYRSNIYKYTLEGKLLYVYKNIREACDIEGYNINNFTNKLYKTHRYKGFIWTRNNEDVSKYFKIEPMKIGKYLGSTLCDTYSGSSILVKHGYDPSSVYKCCSGKRKIYKGFIWRYI